MNSAVPRWRMRKELDDDYMHFQFRAVALQCLHETFKPESTKRSELLCAELQQDHFEGWTLEWERNQRLHRYAKKITSRELMMIFKEVLPFGISPAICYTLTCSAVYIQKRRRGATNGNPSSTVYEITDYHDVVYMRLFRQKTTGILWRRRTSYIGRDVEGVDILKLVWKSTIIPSRQRLTVYCPPHVCIGTVQQTWSLTRSDYVIADEIGRRQALISMRGTQIPFMGPSSWTEEQAVLYSVNTFDGQPGGTVHGDWPSFLREPVFGVIFPPQIGTLMKIMLVAAGILVFDDFFGRRLRGKVLPMDTSEYDKVIRRQNAMRRRTQNLLKLQ